MAGPDPAIQEASTLNYFVYILASKRNGTLYIGVTNDIARRVFEHRQGTASRFTLKYGVTKDIRKNKRYDFRVRGFIA